jgi:RNA polymerase sigma-70 factor, ECF subfamily
MVNKLAVFALTALPLSSNSGPKKASPKIPAWLMTATKRPAINSLRRGRMLAQKHEDIARELE